MSEAQKSLKYAVVGAGAVGCYFGGMLAKAGSEVVLIGRQNNVDAINRDGVVGQVKMYQIRKRKMYHCPYALYLQSK